mmetsp:Transcript_31750/g.60636  ORF Transcript_31750/g.60636 Transcript_31750/m.60636 type:complete len:107 (+) Transcript_31750:119-439(+)|eukprot:CAMPEP_0201606654 /NCGR_PEP_ID=MMETSP0492-20130828/6035_1 /ASSEMBLY_ACC=CAM_ASM_000837 /TAXON_ID=420259 /ORGANISM="Thalassiosira gravida, Strain GMp14c1" /LENGTH=106 /DNA_ID=CAMNT_0048071099 /DNA_START=211 /DNA_END=534 /DNA_ORIENTATION=-
MTHFHLKVIFMTHFHLKAIFMTHFHLKRKKFVSTENALDESDTQPLDSPVKALVPDDEYGYNASESIIRSSFLLPSSRVLMLRTLPYSVKMLSCWVDKLQLSELLL